MDLAARQSGLKISSSKCSEGRPAAANRAQDAGEGAALQHHRQGLSRLAFPEEADLVLHSDIQGAGGLAR
ncbi:MAG TPA: hypothetical protein VIN67_04905, partial [Desulfobaccales bacterium]